MAFPLRQCSVGTQSCRLKLCSTWTDRQTDIWMPSRQITLMSSAIAVSWPCHPQALPSTLLLSLPSSLQILHWSHPIHTANCSYQRGFMSREFHANCFRAVLFSLFPGRRLYPGELSEGDGTWGTKSLLGGCTSWGGDAEGPLLAQGSSLYRLSWQSPSLSLASRGPGLGNSCPELAISPACFLQTNCMQKWMVVPAS